MEHALEPLDIHEEKLISLADAAKKFGVSKCSVMRWVRFGQQGVMLGARKLGAKWYTSEEALQRFTDRLTIVELGGASTAPTVNDQNSGMQTSKVKLLHASDQAGRELRMMGVHGDGRIFETSPASRELLCDLHIFVEDWMPKANGSSAWEAVRSGVFREGVRILEKRPKSRAAYADAIAHIESLDLHSLDVRSLYGVGPIVKAQWNALLKDKAFLQQIKLPKPRQADDEPNS